MTVYQNLDSPATRNMKGIPMDNAWQSLLPYAAALGIGATLIMDAWALLLKRAFDIPSLDYAMVGRWLGHLPRGHFRHDGIGRSAPIAGEKTLGWAAHYLIGILFAYLLLALCGPGWLIRPTPLPALAFGLVSVTAPFLILQPGMGAGIAARNTPNPNTARVRSLAAHAAFGTGLYFSALLLAIFLA
ncbi:DUF2938 domain-containing protein [Chromobacterium vaccinii]|uniref:DUF2938 domain-containing protein n=1 Tax=Chromobacterium vaccinii TaxID=1108595 RepID=UPI001E403236|nr:DUF2938 domain-containing protein [Chromobacterium vaccinii]MCD4485722.1 DUF2938 domain-containing protein [Chromobacterium vaccinii]